MKGSQIPFSKKFISDNKVNEMLFDYKNFEIIKVYSNYKEKYKVNKFGFLEFVSVEYLQESKIVGDFDYKSREIIIKNK